MFHPTTVTNAADLAPMICQQILETYRNVPSMYIDIAVDYKPYNKHRTNVSVHGGPTMNDLFRSVKAALEQVDTEREGKLDRQALSVRTGWRYVNSTARQRFHGTTQTIIQRAFPYETDCTTPNAVPYLDPDANWQREFDLHVAFAAAAASYGDLLQDEENGTRMKSRNFNEVEDALEAAGEAIIRMQALSYHDPDGPWRHKPEAPADKACLAAIVQLLTTRGSRLAPANDPEPTAKVVIHTVQDRIASYNAFLNGTPEKGRFAWLDALFMGFDDPLDDYVAGNPELSAANAAFVEQKTLVRNGVDGFSGSRETLPADPVLRVRRLTTVYQRYVARLTDRYCRPLTDCVLIALRFISDAAGC